MIYENMSDLEIAARVLYARKISHTIEHKTCFIDNGYEDGACVYTAFDPCNNPKDAWPIILENNITLHHNWNEKGKYTAIGIKTTERDLGSYHESVEVTLDKGKELRAAMIVFLMMKDAEK
jgi:hypothetical protein